MRSSWIPRAGPTSMTNVLIRGREAERRHEGGGEAEIRARQPQAGEHLGPQRPDETTSGLPPGAFMGTAPCGPLDLGLLASSTMREYISQFTLVYGSPRKQIHLLTSQ